MSVVTSATLPLPLPEPVACGQLTKRHSGPFTDASGNMQTPQKMGGDTYSTTALL